MPTRNVNLTDVLHGFVLTKVENRRYESSSEVVRAALRILGREEEQYEAKLAALRADRVGAHDPPLPGVATS